MRKIIAFGLFIFLTPVFLFANTTITALVDSLNKRAWEVSENDPSLAIELAKRAYKLSDSIGYSDGSSLSTSYLGVFHTDCHLFAKAQDYFERSVAIREDMGDTLRVAYVYDNLCRLKKEEGDYLEAIRYGLMALRILSHYGKENEEPTVFLNLGIAHQFNNDTLAAIDYYKRGLRVADQLNDIGNKARIHYNWGLLCRRLTKNYLDAQTHFQEALDIYEPHDYKIGMASIYDEIGIVKTELGDVDEAVNMITKSIAINKQIKDSLHLFHNYLNLSRLNIKTKNCLTALSFCKQAEKMITNIGRIEELELLNREFGTVHSCLKNYEKSLQYFKKAEVLKDSMFNEYKARSIQKLQKEQAEREKKEAEILVAKEEAKSQRLIIAIAMISLLVLALIFGLYYINQQRTKKEAEYKAYKQRQETTIDRRIIVATHKIRKELARNLHSHVSTPLTHIKRFIEPIYKQFGFDPELQADLLRVIQIADQTHTISREVLYDLRPENIIWVDRIKLSLMALERKENIKTKWETSGLENDLFSKKDGEKISSIVCNLLSNIDKHAKAENVEVSIKRTEAALSVKVEDDGCGFDPKKKGVGLESIDDYINELKGEIDIDTKIGVGTHVTIKIPVKNGL
ncbi:MAG: tetratricopeptide repeat protein [Bacteroidota bacterium]